VDVAAGLLGAAERWLRQRGCDAMRGPLNPSMKSDFGILVEGHQHPPYIMMSHTSKFYHELLEKNGFAVLRSFFAIAMDGHIRWQSHEQHWAAYEKLCQKIRDRYPQITIRASSKACLGADIRRINELGNLVRAENWGFVPFTPAELDNTVAQLKRVLNPKITFLAEIGERLVGYIMAMPDLNWALQKTIGPWDWLRMPQLLYWLRRCERLRIFGLGVTPELRHSGLAGLLIKRLFDDWSVRYPVWELSWVDSENIRSLRAIRGFVPEEPYKKYHLYERPILPTPAT
jgi:GNAT superfamily N-acetyltransferase